ncbi:hypothetical protein RDABS01_011003, partial [Bienertia sinuspersici]
TSEGTLNEEGDQNGLNNEDAEEAIDWVEDRAVKEEARVALRLRDNLGILIRHALLLGEMDDNAKPLDVILFEFPVWGPVYNLPFKGRLNPPNVEAIGRKLGRYERADTSESRLPIFYFHCGKLGHEIKDCDDGGAEEATTTKYQDWIKVSPWKKGVGGGDKVGNTAIKGCAKKPFVTKPKGTPHRKEQVTPMGVNEMLEKLTKCGIRDKEVSVEKEKDCNKSTHENNVNVELGNECDKHPSKGDHLGSIS